MWKFEFLSHYRRKQDYALYGVFFISLPILFFIGFGHNEYAIKTLGTTYLWISFILTHFLSCQNNLREAFQNGQFEQFLLSKTKIENIILIKIFIQWLSKNAAVIPVIPMILYMISIDISQWGYYILLIFISGLYFETIGFIGSCFAEGTRQAQALFILIMFPFYIPGFILGLLTITSLQQALNPWPYIAMISGLAILFLAITPFIAKQIIKLRIHQ